MEISLISSEKIKFLVLVYQFTVHSSICFPFSLLLSFNPQAVMLPPSFTLEQRAGSQIHRIWYCLLVCTTSSPQRNDVQCFSARNSLEASLATSCISTCLLRIPNHLPTLLPYEVMVQDSMLHMLFMLTLPPTHLNPLVHASWDLQSCKKWGLGHATCRSRGSWCSELKCYLVKRAWKIILWPFFVWSKCMVSILKN